MTNIRCLIIDDEPTARDILRLLINQIKGIDIVAVCKNATEASDIIKKETVDLVFLDINMPGVSGISLARSLPKEIKFVFTTAYREYAIDGFDLQAVDYLLKPISLERMQQAIQKYRQEHFDRLYAKDYLLVRSNRTMQKILFDDIVYIESLSDYLKIHTTTKMIITRERISIIETKLPSSNFVRIHRSFIVAIPCITSFTSEYVLIHEEQLPISRSYRSSFLSKLQ